MENDIQNKLLSFYARKTQMQKNIAISDLTRITSGWETDIYAFKLIDDGKQRDLILRIYSGDGAKEKSAKEFIFMRRLYEIGYPVPEVLLLESDIYPFGAPFIIMEKINGQIMWKAIDESTEERIRELVTQFCKMFVNLHNLDWRLFAPDPSLYDTGDPFNRTLSEMRKIINYFQKDELARPIMDWLESQNVQSKRLSVIHGDYHPANVILRDDGLAFVIDWSNAGINDFRFDLAWTILLVSTYGNPKAREIILNEYERIAGFKIEQIEFFEVYAIARRLFSILVSLIEGADKLGMRPGAEAMIKGNIKHIKAVYGLLGEKTGISIPEIEEIISKL